MADEVELVMTSSMGDLASTINLWNFNSGTFLGSYRGGGICSTHGLAICGGSVIANERLKPMLHSWHLNKQQNEANRLLCAGKVTALDCSPDFCHLAVGVQQNLHLYQINTGRLLGIGSRHFQPLAVVRFNSDGTLIGCGGEDGLVTIWNISRIADAKNCTEPMYTFSEHSLPVSDIAITSGGLRARIISVSGDRTCKVHDLATQKLLVTLVFEVRLTAIALPATEREMYIGNGDGGIHKVFLDTPPRSQNVHISNGSTSVSFIGHTKAVTCLSCSLNCVLLLSGSQDENVKVWHILSGQCLRTIPHKGPVTNVLIFIPPKNMFSQNFKPSVKLHNLALNMDSDEELLDIFVDTDLDMPSYPEEIVSTQTCTNHEIDRLKSINSEIYKFTLNKILGKKLKFHSNCNNDLLESKKPKLIIKKKIIVKRKKNSLISKPKQ